MKYKNIWFTFVEVIVVITILAILASIGFWSYQSYISSGRDTNRIVQLKDIHDGLERISINTRLPSPKDAIEITASGSAFYLQWFAGEGVIKNIWYDGGGRDLEFWTYLTYVLADNKKDFQLLTFVKDPGLLSLENISIYANNNYISLYPKVLGKPLWVLLDSATQNPLHIIENIKAAWSYDIVTGTGSVKAYLFDTKFINSQTESLSKMLPNQNCKRIKDIWRSRWSWVYTINPTGFNTVRVYCDMETEGGWWSIVVNNDNRDDEFIATAENTCYPRLSWFDWYACGRVDKSSDFVVNAQGIDFTELVWGVYEWDFSNIKTYRYLQWDTQQTIPDTSIFQIPAADEDTWLLAWYEDKNLIYCGSTQTDARYIETGAPANWFPHNPVTIIWSISYDGGKIWFTDARANNGIDSNSYGFDDFQDGQSCWDNYSDKTYKWYSSYIMIR